MSRTATPSLPECPKSKITIRDGQVVALEEWTLWNLVPWVTIEMRREPAGFYCATGDPEHGGGSDRGTLEHVLAFFHEKIADGYRRLFELKDATVESVRALGFKRGYEVVVA